MIGGGIKECISIFQKVTLTHKGNSRIYMRNFQETIYLRIEIGGERKVKDGA